MAKKKAKAKSKPKLKASAAIDPFDDGLHQQVAELKEDIHDDSAAGDASEAPDSERLRLWVAELRGQLSDFAKKKKWLDGPLPVDQPEGRFPLTLLDGHRWYRFKKGLKKGDLQRARWLVQAIKDLRIVEAELANPDRLWLPRFFWAVLRVGVYSEKAKAIITTENHNSAGGTKKLTSDEIIKAQMAFEKGSSVAEIMRAINDDRSRARAGGTSTVSWDTVNRALDKKRAPQK